MHHSKISSVSKYLTKLRFKISLKIKPGRLEEGALTYVPSIVAYCTYSSKKIFFLAQQKPSQ